MVFFKLMGHSVEIKIFLDNISKIGIIGGFILLFLGLILKDPGNIYILFLSLTIFLLVSIHNIVMKAKD